MAANRHTCDVITNSDGRPSFIRHPHLFANLSFVPMLVDNRGYTVVGNLNSVSKLI